MIDILEKYEQLQLGAYIACNRLGWDKLKENLADFPFPVSFIDPATYEGQAFTESMIELNEKAYGPGMAAPSWTFANFGTVGAGITGGFLSAGKPVSKFSMVGNVIDPTVAHDWTMLVDPAFEGKSLASLTLAYALQCVQDKKFFSCIAQTDHTAISLYLKFPQPLEILAYGFIHTRRNSLLLKAPVPTPAFGTFLQSKAKPCSLTDHPVALRQMPPSGSFFLAAYDHGLFLQLNERLIDGQRYFLRGRVEESRGTYLLISDSDHV